MVTISKKVEYAIMLISYLSDFEEEYISLTKICQKLDLPYRFIGQISVEMKNGGILLAHEGRRGGYRLCKNWQDVNLYELIKILGEDKALVECLCNDGNCSCGREAKCKLKKLWTRLERVFREEVKAIKLGEIKI